MKLPRIGILSHAHIHAAAYAEALRENPNIHFVGIADWALANSPEKSIPEPVYVSDKDLLASRLDGAIVTSENATHLRFIEAAAEAGVKAILCEKPIAASEADARAILEACRSHNVHLATAFPCRYSPAFGRILTQVRSGEIGEILAIRATNRGTMPGSWFIDKELSGGGAVIDHTVHVADLIQVLLGCKATEVYAEIGNGFYHQEWDDTGFLTIKYANGVFATLDTSWSRPKSYPTWGDVTMEIVGTLGVLRLDMFAQHLAHYGDDTKKVTWPFWGSNIDAELIADFGELASGNSPEMLASGEDGYDALMVALAAYESAKSAQPAVVQRLVA